MHDRDGVPFPPHHTRNTFLFFFLRCSSEARLSCPALLVLPCFRTGPPGQEEVGETNEADARTG